VPPADGGAAAPPAGGGGPATVYFCTLGYGNLAALANDPLIDPDAESPAAAAAAVGPANAAAVPVWVGGVPVPLLVCVRRVAAGGEVLRDYGARYFAAWRKLRALTDDAARRV
jgi:hypothetical protein